MYCQSFQNHTFLSKPIRPTEVPKVHDDWIRNGNEVSKQTSKRWQILAKTPDFEAEKPFY